MPAQGSHTAASAAGAGDASDAQADHGCDVLLQTQPVASRSVEPHYVNPGLLSYVGLWWRRRLASQAGTSYACAPTCHSVFDAGMP
jgi:hypothetical protein